MKHGWMTFDGKFYSEKALAEAHEASVNKGLRLFNSMGSLIPNNAAGTSLAGFACIHNKDGNDFFCETFGQSLDPDWRGILVVKGSSWEVLATDHGVIGLMKVLADYTVSRNS